MHQRQGREDTHAGNEAKQGRYHVRMIAHMAQDPVQHPFLRQFDDPGMGAIAVSYTHLTLPTKRIV